MLPNERESGGSHYHAAQGERQWQEPLCCPRRETAGEPLLSYTSLDGIGYRCKKGGSVGGAQSCSTEGVSIHLSYLPSAPRLGADADLGCRWGYSDDYGNTALYTSLLAVKG